MTHEFPAECLPLAIAAILREHRHLMHEAERRADRAFFFQQKADGCDEPQQKALMLANRDEALNDPAATALFQKGRQRFGLDLAQRVIDEHWGRLPRCEACGVLFRRPSPKSCFDCDIHGV